MVSKCEIIKCKYYIDGKCTDPFDYVNKNTEEPMCVMNTDAIPKDEYDYPGMDHDNRDDYSEEALRIWWNYTFRKGK